MKKSVDPGRLAFKYLNYFMVFLWRLGMGKILSVWPEVFGKYMVITHRGRKSGQQYRTPVNYAEIQGEIYCTAGFGPGSDWFRNLLANPQVEIWLPNGWYTGTAVEQDVTGVTLPFMRQVLVNSGFVSWMMGLDLQSMSDEALLEYCKDYRLVQIHRSAARTGSDGPGDLAWIWPILFALLLLRKPAKRKK